MPNWIYYSPRLFDVEVVDIEEPKLKGEKDAKAPSLSVKPNDSSSAPSVPAAQQDLSFIGHEMKAIVETWWKVNGGTPVKGERHQQFVPLACDLKTILGSDADAIFQAIASYSLFDMPEREVRQECQWVCSQKNTKMSWKLRRAIEMLNGKALKAQPSLVSTYSAPTPPPLPQKLPPMIAAITSRLPKIYVPYVAHNIFSALAVYLFNVKLCYIDNYNIDTATRLPKP